MSTETTIQNLPDEMLEHILLFLNLEDRKSALQVCRRWSTLRLFVWSSMQLMVDFVRNSGLEANYHQTLLQSNRPYKNIKFCFGDDSEKHGLLVDILQHFSENVETLILASNNASVVKLKVFAQIVAHCSNLRCLHIYLSKFDSSREQLEFSPMHNLEELLYRGDNLFNLIPNMNDITPNITRLHIRLGFGLFGSQQFLGLVKPHLLELNVCDLNFEFFLATLCWMQFPQLEKINCHFEEEAEEDHGMFGELVLTKIFDYFFCQLPLLKEVTLRNGINQYMLQSLCRACVNLEYLCVNTLDFPPNGFRAICELKFLQHLRIEGANIYVPTDSYMILISLETLMLNSSYIDNQDEFNRFVEHAFPNLVSMEILEPRTQQRVWLESKLNLGSTELLFLMPNIDV